MKLSAAGFNARNLSLNQAEAPSMSLLIAAHQHICCMSRCTKDEKLSGIA
jgi:hypothetical protein